MPGLEPGTSCTPCKRATRLRHTPITPQSIAEALFRRKPETGPPRVAEPAGLPYTGAGWIGNEDLMADHDIKLTALAACAG